MPRRTSVQKRLTLNGARAKRAKLLPKDKVILLLGRSGVGKSTFTQLATGTEKKIVGHSLESCTKDVEVFSYEDQTGCRVVVVDTPGFDDDVESEFEILQRIAKWLKKSYNEGVRLSGILYLHRISDNRFSASASRYLLLLQQIVGEKGLPDVHLVTTMVTRIQPEEAAKRHQELQEKHWADLVRNGATMYTAYEGTPESARALLDSIELKAIVPALQKEVAIENKPLQRTKAGKDLYKSFLQYILEKIRKIIGPLEALLDKGGYHNGPTDAKGEQVTLSDLQRKLREFDDTQYPKIVQKVRKTSLQLADLAEKNAPFKVSVIPLGTAVLNALNTLPAYSEKNSTTVPEEMIRQFATLEGQLEATKARIVSVSTA